MSKSLTFNTQPQNYQDIKSQMLPLDIIAFRGGEIVSDIISFLQREQVESGEFSHVGIVVTADILPCWLIDDKKIVLNPDHIYILESTFNYQVPNVINCIPDVLTNKGKLGVQLRDLDLVIPDWLYNDTTKVAWCKLINNPFEKKDYESNEAYILRKAVLIEKFHNVFNKYYGRMYEMDILTMISSLFPSFRVLRDSKDYLVKKYYSLLNLLGLATVDSGPAGWQFCSELVGNIYQEFDILSKDFDTSDIVPMDFFGFDQDGLPILIKSPVYIKDW